MKEWLKEAVAFIEERGLVQHAFEVGRVACPNDWLTIDIGRGEFVDGSVMCRVARQRSGSVVEAHKWTEPEVQPRSKALTPARVARRAVAREGSGRRARRAKPPC